VPSDISLLDQVSPAVQDYVKALYMLSSDSGDRPVPTTAVADRLGVSAASATKMLKRLAGLGLATHESYRGAALTPPGVRIALEVIRHHRLLETYLAEALGVPWDEVHQEAEVLEHVLSEGLEDRIAALLGDPSQDPHGHPIPAKDGSIPATSTRSLWDCADGETACVGRVSDHEPRALRYLGDAGVRPGVVVTVVERGPIGGPLFVRVGSAKDVIALSKELSEVIWVD
jgi:DtxR family Mn-dependent transcriptional regulator